MESAHQSGQQSAASQSLPASARGAVDLSALQSNVRPEQHSDSSSAMPVSTASQVSSPADDVVSTRVDLPLIVEATDQSFEPVFQTSTIVPVIVLIWSQASLESRAAIDMMEEVARRFAGRFQLVKVDLAQGQGIAQAFQVQNLPAVAALIAGRPVPMFQGSASAEQVVPVVEELLGVAAQMGVTAGIRVSEEDTATPIPEEHLAARQAEEAGDMTAAVAAWEKVVEHHPKDQVALAELARLRLVLRASEHNNDASIADQADAAFTQGRHEEAFDLLLSVVAQSTDNEEKDAARARLVELFRVAGPTDPVKRARQKLATLLMI